jgi:hypothetical protein
LRLINKRPSAATGEPPTKIQKVDDGAKNIDYAYGYYKIPNIQKWCDVFI